MTTATPTHPAGCGLPLLENGERMTREEFHRAYQHAPRGFKAESIGGVVHLPSPLRRMHGRRHGHLGMLFAADELNTPGTEAADNATILLGDESEPQPDLMLRILPEFGGTSKRDRNDYVIGPPELVAEISQSSRSIDLFGKRQDYTRNGVREYLVMSLGDRKLHWFDLRANHELPATSDGVIRVVSFPGLWINIDALFAPDYSRLMGTLQKGLESAEHADFVRQLAAHPAKP